MSVFVIIFIVIAFIIGALRHERLAERLDRYIIKLYKQ